MQVSPSYQAALDYIFSFIDYSKTHRANLDPNNFDLGRMFSLMARLGNPQERYPSIHITGTKGKGSTAAFCSRVLQTAGYKTGLYTSPHLQDFCERIQVDGNQISQEELVELVDEIKPHVAAIPQLSTFEIITALGFWHFQKRGVTAAVIEVGLGGRLDATNVVNPLVSVITSISLDHTPILGTTIAEIAAEKAGIIKPKTPVITSPQTAEALSVIRQISLEKQVYLTVVGEDVIYEPLTTTLDSQSFTVSKKSGTDTSVRSLRIPLVGEHQVENAATAWAVLKFCSEHHLKISDQDIKGGFADVFWPGRFEIIQKSPLVILDAAHNLDSARRLLQTIETLLPEKQITLIFGSSADKDVYSFIKILRPVTRMLIASQSIHPRALPSEVIKEKVAELGIECITTENIETALSIGLSNLSKDGAIIVTGSIFIVGGAREVFESVIEHLGGPM